MNQEIKIWVPGIPQPGGSKKAFFNPKLGRSIVTEDNAKSKNWRTSVSQVASEQVAAGFQLLDGPVALRVDFMRVRPKGHYNFRRDGSKSLKSNAPAFPTTKPDATKLMRSTEDALKGILWRDDSQVVTQVATKRWGEQPGAWIRVKEEKV